MTIAVHKLTVSEFQNTPLNQIIASAEVSSLPVLFTLDDTELTVAKSLALSVTAQNTEIADAALTAKNQLELVVFADINLGIFSHLVKQCQINLLALNAINHRNNLTSLRFNVTCENASEARQALAQFNINNGTESVLIENAPSLNEPGLLLMDMDSTTIKIECIDELAKLAGVGEQVAEVTELAMQGKLDFTQSLYQRVGTLANSPVSILDTVLNNLPLMEGLETLVTELKKYQWRVAIASGGFAYFADHLKETLGLDAAVANTLEIKDGLLTGKVLGDVVDAKVKASTLLALAKEFNIADSQTVAMGDGANDLVMMSAAALGVAFHAKPLVVKQADVGINQQGLDCLLHWLA